MRNNSIFHKIFGISLYLIHWFLVFFTVYLVFISNDLITLLILDLFIYLVIQLNLIFNECPVNIIEDLYIGEEKDKFEKIFQYRKIISNDSSIHGLFMSECVALLKTGWILLHH
jgi:predicted ABC-type exoprotein transport system permease subunit